MIYLVQNKKEYDYDIRAILLAFFEREKIVDVTEKEPGTDNPRFLIAFDFGEGTVYGKIEEDGVIKTERTIVCDYEDHGAGRRPVDKFIYQLISDYAGRTLPCGTLTGIRPTSSGIKPNFTISWGITSLKIPVFFRSAFFFISLEKPIVWFPWRFSISLSKPSKAPPQIKRIFSVLI